mmetsp:Transcript_78450/g.114881  ORF Transcript_78450/g.114881 Transcript_78450/m.114881 type:complete len:189 (+) Transcript_78450:23-589(+)
MTKILAGAAAATAMCLLLAVVIDKTPAAVLAQTKGLACGRGGLCPNGPAFIRKVGLTSAAEVEWAKGFPVENAADKAPTVMLKQVKHSMYYEPNGVQQLSRSTSGVKLPAIPAPYAPKRRTFTNTPYFHAKAPTQMLWNAQATSPYNPMTHERHDAELMKDHGRNDQVNSMISQWGKQADLNPAGTDY